VAKSVKRARTYDVSGRQRQAQERRRRIRDAAKELFLEHGYANTAVRDVALRAGVSEALVYAQFGSKVALLKEVYDVTLAGDDEPVPIPQRPQAQRWSQENDPTVILREYAAAVRLRQEQLAGLRTVIDAAAAVDSEAAALAAEHDAQRWHGMQMLAEILLNTGRLAPDLDGPAVAAQLWLLNSAQVYRLCTASRGWTGEQYQQWLARTWIRTLLG
jgi:AcrR family transcriptional regulator